MLVSQTELSSSDSLVIKDKLLTINKLRLGMDLFKPIKSSSDGDNLNYEIVGDLQLTENLYLAGEYGLIDKLIEKKYVTVGANPQQEYKIENYIKKNKCNDIDTNLKTINLGGKSKDLLIPTELGIDVIKYIFEVLPYLCDLKFTSNMEKDLDDIINLKNNKKTILDDIYNKISKSLKNIGIDDNKPSVIKNGKNIKLNKEDYKDGIVKTRYGICYYNKSNDTYTNIESYLKWKGKDVNNLDSKDINFLSLLPKDVVYLNTPYKLHLGRYGLYLKDDKHINHKIEKKIWDTFI